jgi:hypothetical protein
MKSASLVTRTTGSPKPTAASNMCPSDSCNRPRS